MRFGKKGLSDVIATVLIIMLTVVSIGILAGFVVPFVANSLNQGSECLGYNDYFKFQEVLEYKGSKAYFNCYDESSKLHGASVGALKTGEVSGLDINANATSIDLNLVFVSANGESTKVEIRKGQAASIAVGGLRMLNASFATLRVPENGGVQTYVYNSDRIYDTVEVYPVLKNGKVCEKSDRITLTKCMVSLNV